MIQASSLSVGLSTLLGTRLNGLQWRFCIGFLWRESTFDGSTTFDLSKSSKREMIVVRYPGCLFLLENQSSFHRLQYIFRLVPMLSLSFFLFCLKITPSQWLLLKHRKLKSGEREGQMKFLYKNAYLTSFLAQLTFKLALIFVVFNLI